MMTDQLFEGNDDMIIDECLTFFLAGSSTNAVTTANAICYLLMNPNIEQKLRIALGKNFKSFSN